MVVVSAAATASISATDAARFTHEATSTSSSASRSARFHASKLARKATRARAQAVGCWFATVSTKRSASAATDWASAWRTAVGECARESDHRAPRARWCRRGRTGARARGAPSARGVRSWASRRGRPGRPSPCARLPRTARTSTVVRWHIARIACSGVSHARSVDKAVRTGSNERGGGEVNIGCYRAVCLRALVYSTPGLTIRMGGPPPRPPRAHKHVHPHSTGQSCSLLV